MKKYIQHIFLFCIIYSLTGIMSSCNQDDPDNSPYVGPEDMGQNSQEEDLPIFVDPENPSEFTVLIYAVATNSLSPNLVQDKKEMLAAATQIDLTKNNVLLFQTVYEYDENNNRTGNGEVSLLKLVKRGGEYDWYVVKKYSPDIASLNPERIQEVINFVTTNFSATNYGIVFWSHSTGSQPYLEGRSGQVNLPMAYSFGQDKTTTENVWEQINVDELSACLPDNLFEYIWFDSCYMSNIETLYQFRDKCKTYVGYPTEVLADGLPYHLVLPYMVRKDPELLQAADAFFHYYSGSFGTIAVVDMGSIDILADFCKNILFPGCVSGSYCVQYTRNGSGPFYDLGDYLRSVSKEEGVEFPEEEWISVLNECLPYKAATSGGYLGLNINTETYSGLSTHIYNFSDKGVKEQYYQSLDWFKAVFD